MDRESDPDAGWVAALADCPLARARRRLEEARSERALGGYIEREHRREGRPSYVEIDAPLELFALVRELRPEHVVEVGVSSGVSSAYLLAGLARNRRGTLHSVDLPTFRKETARRRPATASWALPPGRLPGWAIPPRLRDRWDLRIGDKRVVLPRLGAELNRVGLFVYDVPHDDGDALREFLRLDPTFRTGSVAIADHGPNGGLCAALQRWATRRSSLPVRREGLGLYGFRSAR